MVGHCGLPVMFFGPIVAVMAPSRFTFRVWKS